MIEEERKRAVRDHARRRIEEARGLRGGPGGLRCTKCAWQGSCADIPVRALKCPKCGGKLKKVGRGLPPHGTGNAGRGYGAGRMRRRLRQEETKPLTTGSALAMSQDIVTEATRAPVKCQKCGWSGPASKVEDDSKCPRCKQFLFRIGHGTPAPNRGPGATNTGFRNYGKGPGAGGFKPKTR